MEKKKTKTSTTKKAVSKKTAPKKVEKTANVKAEVKKVEEVKEVIKQEVKKQDHTLFKIILIVLLVVTLLTWLVKSGSWSYNANEAGKTIAEFTENEATTPTGINEFFLSSYYAVNYYLIQLVFLAILGLFYGVVSKTKGYKALVKKVANIFRSKTQIFTLVSSLLIAGFVSITTQPIVVLTFVPFLYSIAKELKFNKVSAMLMTYGSLAVGLMGVTYGSYGLVYALSNMGVEVSEGIVARASILVAAYLILNMFIVLYNKKFAKNAELVEENFETVDAGNAKAWPMAIVFGLLFVIMVLGYVSWTNMGVEVFTNFHKWLSTELVFGDNKVPVVYNIIGKVTELGAWDPFVLAYIMLIAIVVVKFISKTKWDDVFDNALEGLKVVARPILIVASAYSIFVVCYWSGLVNPIINFFNSGDNFSPYLNTIGNMIADFLHIDVEYTGFSYAALYASKYADRLGQVMACMTSAAGLVAICAPTSMFMITGLTLSKLSYKDYLKAAWKLLVALVIVIALILTVVTFL